MTTNSYNQSVGQYPNYVNGQVNYPPSPRPKSKRKSVGKKRKGVKKMARRRNGGKMKGGNLKLMGVLFFFAVIYFSSTISSLFTGFWVSLNLPSLGNMQSLVITGLTAIVAYYAYTMLKPLLRF